MKVVSVYNENPKQCPTVSVRQSIEAKDIIIKDAALILPQASNITVMTLMQQPSGSYALFRAGTGADGQTTPGPYSPVMYDDVVNDDSGDIDMPKTLDYVARRVLKEELGYVPEDVSYKLVDAASTNSLGQKYIDTLALVVASVSADYFPRPLNPEVQFLGFYSAANAVPLINKELLWANAIQEFLKGTL